MMMVLDENASGNNDIDKFIQDTQLSVRYDTKEALEWIPYDRLFNIEYIADGKFGKVYRANWIDGCIDKWDNENQNWKRVNQKKPVILKSSNNITFRDANGWFSSVSVLKPWFSAETELTAKPTDKTELQNRSQNYCKIE
ncbi:kinase-like domain-containing protein [Rhizophagus irregularis DAOM 181602=DAOM 197198]|uniref:Protein kinase domain-containing protein n=1 Tax=Rhizophagus irregularis (strain DAOM 197198w) TaxID=1432141 RepID=A0A015N4Z0_RHIIW|nr:hypothetical protein RirG_053710 [Rhizophagus irregularis DAOM 197198w]GBC40328.1 kinase-like domain-containing protein [Rhizophagus irregularis DAOM 181602=DAOM 197198]